MSRPLGRSRRFLAVAAALLAALGAAGFAATAAPSAGAAPAVTVGPATHWAVTRPMCAQPSDPQALRCYAMARVPVAHPSPDAYRYTVAADVAHGPAGGYTPGDLARAYNFNPRIDRRNMTVGVVLWHDDPQALHDLNVFDKHYGFPTETPRSFRKVNAHGHARPLPPADRSIVAEVSLDLQTIRSVCRRCPIVLVEADAGRIGDTAVAENTAVRLGAQVVNNSYGAVETQLRPSIVRAYNHPGHVLVASTGDDGWFGWDESNVVNGRSDNAPSFPASSPDVVSVGGTTLTLTSAGTRKSESVWNLNGATDDEGAVNRQPLGASGSGCSRRFAAQPWQRHQHGYRPTHCYGHRSSADIAAVADPVTGFDIYDSYAGGWVTLGGTSLAAPLISGMYALAGGSRGVQYPSSQLYVNADLYPKRRYDVRTGGTGYCGGAATTTCATVVEQRYNGAQHNPNNLGRGLLDCSFPRGGRDAVKPPLSTECNAAVGFDGPSGIGTPTGLTLFHPTQPRVTITRPKVKRVGHAALYIARVRESVPDTRAASYVWTWGDGRRTVTKRAQAHHTFRRVGRFPVTVRVTDTRWQTGIGKTATRVIR